MARTAQLTIHTKQRLDNIGDTIVEVLICMVLIAFILTGAYISANDSFLNIREAQMRIEALGIAQGQLETLRAQSQNITSTQLMSQPYFCFNSSGAIVLTGLSTTPPCQNYNNTPFSITITYIGESPVTSPLKSGGTDYDPVYNFNAKVTWVGISPNSSDVVNKNANAQLSIFYRTSLES